jgi:hypothetical protein
MSLPAPVQRKRLNHTGDNQDLDQRKGAGQREGRSQRVSRNMLSIQKPHFHLAISLVTSIRDDHQKSSELGGSVSIHHSIWRGRFQDGSPHSGLAHTKKPPITEE